ncbi:Deoxyribonuclease TATDN2 [Caenorhabditis elegans]|uniref:Deoxyribonuclease TATDN2 n=2 Tax=Caenorhabditis elegans TaxID=6239 RepID=Q9U2N7_CAEEL|nr:Deoxyribonuclease TATDN2 [Caenorhabditis elegans]CAB60573.1 Deoxyribonuclease TATDN2 [Caenorhabditis elegans]|eukprot:NP_001256781.1 Uncharacterized protein CELE_Y37H2A.1 [Caenorhabditis elegans]
MGEPRRYGFQQPPPPPNCCEDGGGIEDGLIRDSGLNRAGSGSGGRPVSSTSNESWRNVPWGPPGRQGPAVHQHHQMVQVHTRRLGGAAPTMHHSRPPPPPLDRRPMSPQNASRPLPVRGTNYSTNGDWPDQRPTIIQQSSRINSFPNRPVANNSYHNENIPFKDIILELHEHTVPFIDSHCHVDFMYNQMVHNNPNSSLSHGLSHWIHRYPYGFPKSFYGVIANFIKPSLFVVNDGGGGNGYDIDWIINEIESNIYLGTTWGCHPHYAQEWASKDIFWQTLEHILSNAATWKVLAVGECGLDLHRCISDLEVQKMVFEKHIDLAYKYQLPLVIHCRSGQKGRAEEQCLRILKKKMDENHKFLKIHRHCFTETWEVAQMWMKQCPNVYFGYTAAIFKMRERQQLEAIRHIPLNRILLETDAPYFRPPCFEGVGPRNVCLPGMAIATARKIAEIKELPVDEVLRATFDNTRLLYQIQAY